MDNDAAMIPAPDRLTHAELHDMWLMPRDVRMNRYYEAYHESQRMRRETFARWTVNGDSTLTTRIDKWDLLTFTPRGR